MRRWSLLALGPIAALSACQPSEPRRDVADDRNHSAARTEILAACRGERVLARTDSRCANAIAADGAATSKAFWTAPAPHSRVSDPGKL